MADDTTAPAEASISMFENGPLQVEGGVPLIRQHRVDTERGEPIAYRTYDRLDTDERYFLCRCGGSSNKPYCDGTHAKIGFESDESERALHREAEPIGGTSIVIDDDRAICTSAGFCADSITNVWELAERIDVDTLALARAVEMVERCPSGALAYRLEGEGDAEYNEPELPAQVAVQDHGPLVVRGMVPVTNSAGEQLETRNRVSLCRCGASSLKPLCDATHVDIGFQDGRENNDTA